MFLGRPLPDYSGLVKSMAFPRMSYANLLGEFLFLLNNS